MQFKNKIIEQIQSAWSRSKFFTLVALKLENQAKLIIKRRYSAKSCESKLNGEFLLIETIAPFCKCFIDVGANIGDWTEKILSEGLANISGVVFEPGDSAYNLLHERFSQDPRIKIQNIALSDIPGRSTFYEQPNAGEMSSFVQNYTEVFSGQKSSEMEIVVSTLDCEVSRLNIGYIDFLKIDTEGYDLKAIKGAINLLKNHTVGIVQFEYNAPWANTNSTLVEAYQLLESCGYKVFHLGQDGLFTYDVALFGDYYSYSNYVAVSPDSMKIIQPLIKGKI